MLCGAFARLHARAQPRIGLRRRAVADRHGDVVLGGEEIVYRHARQPGAPRDPVHGHMLKAKLGKRRLGRIKDGGAGAVFAGERHLYICPFLYICIIIELCCQGLAGESGSM